MPRENIMAFYRIKNEIEDLTDKLGTIEEEIGNHLCDNMQKKLRNLLKAT